MKNADCTRAKNELLGGLDRVSVRTARHLETCDGCAVFAERFAATRSSLRRHRSPVVPDAGFAARVTAALPAAETGGDLVSRAALRLLPAAIALTIVLGAWSWLSTASPASLTEGAPTDDVLAWVLDNGS